MLRLARSLRARDRAATTCAWPAAWRSTASPTARCCARASSRSIWIQPAAGDAGGALGAALAAYHHVRSASRAAPTARARRHAGRLSRARASPGRRSRAASTAAGAQFATLDDDDLIDAHGAGAGRRQGGRLVPGPHGVRAARARRRSILGDPRSPSMQKMLNLKVKYRESFRPFAPVGAARGRRRLVRARRRQPLHAAGRRRARRAAAAR